MPHDIMLNIDGSQFYQSDMEILQQITEIIADSGSVGHFELGNIKMVINSLTTYEHELIVCN